jgi:hypothetical protein
MKYALFIIAFLLSALATTSLMSFKGSEAPEAAEFNASAGVIHTYAWPLDTLANATKDTLTFPGSWLLLSNFATSYHVTRTNISGTTNVKVYVQASGLRTGATDWATIDSTSSTGATTAVIMLPNTYGQRHRIIVSGSGTQSTSYTVSSVLKRTN